MKRFMTSIVVLALFFSPVTVCRAVSSGETRSEQKIDMDINVNREHRDVGMKRMELIDKTLSRELMERKRDYVQKIEQDYNQKILQLVNSIIPQVFNNKVMTHLDVNFFAADFESQISANQKVAVSIIITREGFNSWVVQNPSEQEAMHKLSGLINTVFKILPENISILIVK